ncbi:metallophosphoesterase family protein [Bradyrhizobium sp. WSM1253]|uniref:metallophosphoesterase family protein n=1 Tax=Bradyrhizobium sp. WSM1253 TaxID=319003 RepID=UPI001FDA6E46|nr:metallophosphoesterase family protein [Bradyrhizobium sp. WSM1253]
MAGVDHIIHAGDIGRPEIVRRASPDRARHRHPWKRGQWRVGSRIPDTKLVRLAGKSIYVLHDLKTLQADPRAGIDVIVSGHTHVPKIDTVGGVLYLNPGSAGPRRFKLPITIASLEVTREGMRPEIHDLGAD